MGKYVVNTSKDTIVVNGILKVLLIENYADKTICDAILIKESDEDDIVKLLYACETSFKEQNEYYECEYHGFFKYLDKRKIWYKHVDVEEYRY